jgi:hypothetical protein
MEKAVILWGIGLGCAVGLGGEVLGWVFERDLNGGLLALRQGG